MEGTIMHMPGPTKEDVRQNLEHTFREEGGRVRAALIGSLRDFELAEDVLQERGLACTAGRLAIGDGAA
jgi:hypothetical protein